MSEKEKRKELKNLINSLKELIERIFGFLDNEKIIEYRKEKTQLLAKIKSNTINIDTSVDTSEIKKYFESLLKYETKNNSALYKDNYYENLILGEFMYEVVGGEATNEGFTKYTLHDEINNIEYEISPISNEYMILILQNITSRLDDIRYFQAQKISFPYYDTKLNQNDYLKKYGLFTNLRVFFNSLKIRTKKKRKLDSMKRIANSFCFKLSSSTNQPIILSKDLSKKYTQYLDSISSDYDLVVPEKLYKDNLIYYYQMALSTQMPVLQYLFFYQIIEYFFENSYFESWIEFFKERIKKPNIIDNENRNIKQLINEIYYKYNYRPNKINESKALELTLEKYIRIEKLEEDISWFKFYIEYYKKEMASFAINESDDKNLFLIDFNEKENIFQKLAKRIYAIRNSLVHSKESFENRFKPFEDEEELIKEIPLIRIIAEEIIFNSGEELQ